MVKIVSIKPLRQEQATLIIQDGAAMIPHMTTMSLLYRYHLSEGQTISKQDYKRFIQDNEFEILYLAAVNFISYQMRTIAEVKKKLHTKTKDDQVISKIIAELKKQNYLGDTRYVEEYVNEKMNYDLVGPRHIKDKLIQKGIHFDLVDSALINYTTELQFQKVEELLQKELKYPPKKPYLKFADSFKRKCVNKGFSLSVVSSLLTSFKEDIIASIDEETLLKRELQAFKKPVATYDDKQKRIQTLRRKGFSYQVIQKYIV